MNIIFTLVVLQGGWLKVSCKTPGGRGMVKAKIFSPFHSVRAMVDDVKSRLAPCYDIDVFMKRLRCKNINNFGLICVQCEEELLAKVPAADRSLLQIDPCLQGTETTTHAHVLESAAQRPLDRELRQAGRVCRFDVLTQV